MKTRIMASSQWSDCRMSWISLAEMGLLRHRPPHCPLQEGAGSRGHPCTEDLKNAAPQVLGGRPLYLRGKWTLQPSCSGENEEKKLLFYVKMPPKELKGLWTWAHRVIVP